MNALARVVVFGLLSSSLGCVCTGGPVPDCKPVETVCAVHEDCCSFGCLSGQCQCNPEVGGTCRSSSDCCPGMRCTDQKCETGCHRPSESCLTNADCCSGECAAGACVAAARACGIRGDGCSDVEPCCDGLSCAWQSRCQPPTCGSGRYPQRCTADAECCGGKNCNASGSCSSG